MWKADHFTFDEMKCQGENCCGGSSPMSQNHMNALDKLRYRLGCALRVNSGFRCRKHNKAIGGVDSSFHTLGEATDLSSPYASPAEIANEASGLFEEIIIYDTFCHVANAY